ncbi:MAG TPA: polysaccharide pyruvyl transferase family protein, partial [Solirubrobacteraceae bacterium]|nr:polysaccharide pyruvyl transferase family protein [Solirubrobacteraceae bacterium]
MSSSPRVLLVGAYERDNFGDLLFLLVTERYLDGAEVVAAAPFSADMRTLLDRDIPAYGPLLRDEAFDAIWTVGGQVGRVDLRRAYKMSATPDEWAAFEAAPQSQQRELLLQATGGEAPLSPYIPLPAAHPRNAGAVTVLNSVGISGVRSVPPRRREAVVGALRGATSIAVRDDSSSALLTELGIEHRLLPDAVHAISRVHPAERDDGADTAIVQISSARLRMLGHARVGRALALSSELRGRPIRLLLAGTATGHDSVEDYERVARAARGADIAIVPDRRPLALVEHLRRARVVIGTSLHVRIVAAAYGVPRVSLSKPKPTRYARLWDPDMPFDVGLAELDDAVGAAVARAATPAAAAHADRLSRAAHEHLERTAVLALSGAGDTAARAAARQRDHVFFTKTV